VFLGSLQIVDWEKSIYLLSIFQCAILSPTFRVRDFSIQDCQPFPITLSWQGGGLEEEWVQLTTLHPMSRLYNLQRNTLHYYDHFWFSRLFNLIAIGISLEILKCSIFSSQMEVFPQFHQFPFSKMLTFYRTEPFTIEARYTDPSQVPISQSGIGKWTIFNIQTVKTRDGNE
jgi:hypothetical protein